MTADEQQVAWTAINNGAAVVGEDGSDLGKVTAVVADTNKDIFSGLAFRPGLFDTEQFIPADLVDTITPDEVRVRLTPEAARGLDPYEG